MTAEVAAASSSSHSSASTQRLAHPTAILPNAQALRDAKVLVVGAGGIGCEVLKNLALVGVKGVQVIDLDTIDLSNLNRQFLFNKSHIKKSKALVASAVASSFNPSIQIQPQHANIKEPQFGYEFFKTFDVVLNALDNLDARRWVNRMCIATNVPLVESGTTGFLGQVQPILKGVMACYDCTEKQTQKTFPVCTIRSTPTTPIHCVVWAKTWLFNQLFGEDDETEGAELDKAEADGGNSAEISALRKEALEMSNLRSSLGTEGAAQRVFDKVFKNDIERLLSMEEMWKNRTKPTPITYADAMATAADSQTRKGLKDQTQLGLKETVDLFESSLNALALRSAANPSEPLSFDKDDSDALDFVTASSNLRSRIYSIETKNRFDIKQMAGNIIPAIASTNAIISGALVLQTVHMLGATRKGAAATSLKARDVMLGRSNRFVLTGSAPPKPNPACGVCQDLYIPVSLDPRTTSLGAVISHTRLNREESGLGMDDESGYEELGIYEGSRLLADMDFEDNHPKTLFDLGVETGKFLTLVDEDGKKRTVHLVLCAPRDGLRAGEIKVLLEADELPELSDRPKLPEAEKDESDLEDGDKDDGFEVMEAMPTLVSKKRKAGDDGTENGAGQSQQKKRPVGDENGDDSRQKRHKAGPNEGAIELD
ncbi:hypothetical protein BCV69DRAFT_246849 [Microstroma glucosiphilum]|uniref:Ubiquitin-activating enzyme E1-like n=1 Tax=Pseudomicrostroma glucosiphilum TaxID=1684307 RepID=A0A316UBL2_9BASI|nr:hypothetical protein BCV69DRAFT_246849 [Pseudomicrostroma glucosiphilum]PWN21793.1 hypothetical protein BCV69DRAFT_246849 [Pseudomicrostroma glucosiphilum]